MSVQKRKNLATTEDGAPYNKRPRPDFTYSHEPLPDIAHLGHPDLEPEDDGAHDDGKDTSNGSPEDSKHQVIYQSNNTLFNAKIRGHGVGRGGVDADSGQKFSLPIDDANTSDDDTNAARKYLRDVRSEARGIPTVLFAPPNNDYADADEDEEAEYTIRIPDSRDAGGYYEDGAYIAGTTRIAPNPSDPFSSAASSASSTLSLPPQETYHTRIRTLFLHQRALLHSTPPSARISSLATSQPIWIPRHGKFHQLREIITRSDPVPAQIASMDAKSAWRLLDVCRRVLHPGMRIRKRLSAWIWSLLGRLPEVGVLGMDDVSEIRVLAKTAVAMRAAWDERCRVVARRRMLLEGMYFSEPRGKRRREEEEEEEEEHEEQEEEENVEETHINGDGGKEPAAEDADDDEGQAMDLESESEKGQIDEEDVLAAAKLRLLRNLDTSQPPNPPPDQKASNETIDQDSDLEDGEVDEPEDTPSAAPVTSTERKEEDEEAEDDIYPDVNTRVTCDMIITVVGDIFGQRDLLACREDWDE